MTSQPLVSVITPVYNTEKYLSECVESVLAQAYENWEYVIVNNCSTDRSLKIAEHYAQKDARIRIHNNRKFLSQLQNWNHAFHQISTESKYCKVVHADDWLFSECLTRMVGVAEANPSVGIVGAYRLDENRVNLDGLPYPSYFVTGREICRLHLLNGKGRLQLFGSPTSLLYRADLVRGQQKFYDESNIHADTEACFRILQNADFGFVHQVLTYTRRHNETATTFARLFNTYMVSNITVLVKYGSIYLNGREKKVALKQYMKSYYRFLGQSIFKLRTKEYWTRKKEFYTYHKTAMKELGFPINWYKVLGSSCVFLYNRILGKLKL